MKTTTTADELAKMGLVELSPGLWGKPHNNLKPETIPADPSKGKPTFIPESTTSDKVAVPFNLVNQFIFDIVPFPAPRMTRSDKWKTDPNHLDPKKRQRLCVKRYFDFREGLQRQAREQGYKLTAKFDIIFYMPMPESWSKKKKQEMNLTPHQSKPDWDNLCKGFQDCLTDQDNFVWDVHARKFWAEKGQIMINQ